MKIKTILILIACNISLTVNAQSYLQKNIEAHRNILGYEPEELLENGYVSTQEAEIGYNTAFVNGLHAYFSNSYPYAAIVTKVGDNLNQYSSEELFAMEQNLIYGFQVDTLNKTIVDKNGGLINTFTDISSFYMAMYQLVDEIVDEDIDVLPIGISEKPTIPFRKGQLIGNLYPNPTCGKFTVELAESTKNVLLKIFNSAGRLLLQQEINKNEIIDLNGFPKGLYLLQVSSNGYFQTEKVVIQ